MYACTVKSAILYEITQRKLCFRGWLNEYKSKSIFLFLHVQISVGDHIEKINGQVLVGCRHFEVARKLKDIPRGSLFTIRLIEPQKAGFGKKFLVLFFPGNFSSFWMDTINAAAIGPRSNHRGGKPNNVVNGKATLRLRATGPATVEDAVSSC